MVEKIVANYNNIIYEILGWSNHLLKVCGGTVPSKSPEYWADIRRLSPLTSKFWGIGSPVYTK